MVAQGLRRAQDQLAGRVPPATRLALLQRAQMLQPTLDGARQMVGLALDAGDPERAAQIFAGLPPMVWRGDHASTGWFDHARQRLLQAGLAPPRLPESSDTLVISFAFPPFANTAGNVMARRIETAGERVDVISNDMTGRAGLDLSLYAAIRPLIGRHLLVTAENWPARATAARQFSEIVVEAVRSGATGRRHYREIRSRAMWAQSHFAAAALLAAGLADRWVAEFSDPCRLDLDGNPAQAPADEAWLEQMGISALIRDRGYPVPTGKPLMFWAEYLPFCLAERIIFTNPVQQALMLSQDDPQAVRDRARAVSEISPHPQPGPLLLSHLPATAPPDRLCRVGYFGHANPRRGLGELLHAMAALQPGVAQRLVLHVFGTPDPALPELVARLGLGRQVRISPPLGYLDALARMREMRWLFLNDTATAGAFARNPYLPSKLSDYLSADLPLLAVVEPDSPLANTPLPEGSIKAPAGDMPALQAALQTMLAGADADAM
ncbi:hypothetical protein SAMN05421538_101456 [Paracoccus isoporae]|uniref:Uncharacterized protein n=2 Tax=Paracoccus isoporae TaxID=591205 RepID=A0A1G6U4L3_9RHOB|nr:hypothetical protein SAMN05421538_101456 [Paracoccus isoporae]